MAEKQPDWADRLIEKLVRESEWRYTPRRLNLSLWLIGLAGVLLTIGSGWAVLFALLAATHVSIRVRVKPEPPPPDLWGRDRYLTDEEREIVRQEYEAGNEQLQQGWGLPGKAEGDRGNA